MAQSNVQRFPIPAGKPVQLVMDGGDLAVRGSSATDGAVITHSGAVQVHDGEEGIVVQASGEVVLRLPAASSLTVRGTWDDAAIQGLRGTVDLDGGHGDVLLRDLTGDAILAGSGDDLVADGVATLRLVGAVAGDLTLRRVGVAEGSRIEGDLAVFEVQRLALAAVEGDAVLTAARQVTIEQIGGDLTATRIGSLETKRVDGDVHLHETGGPAELASVGGDLTVTRPGASVNAAAVEGDLEMQGEVAAGARCHFRVHRDALVAVRGPVRLVVQAGGDLHLPPGLQASTPDGRRFEGVIGEGEPQAEIEVIAGGDVRVGRERGVQVEMDFDFDQVARDVERDVRRAVDEARRTAERELRRAMAEVERVIAGAERWCGPEGDRLRSEAWFSGFGSRPPRAGRRVGIYVRDAIAEWLQQFRAGQAAGAAPPPPEEDLSEETLAILRMVREGRLTAEEAEKLLDAMGA